MLSDRHHAMTRRLLPLTAAVALALPGLAAAQAATLDYIEAKARADRDEAALPADLGARMRQAQAQALEAGVGLCGTPKAVTTPFTIVVQLDAQGTVVESWRKGGSPLAICAEKFLRQQPLPAPPQAPTFVSYELTFTP
jgi:hypothetical protein